jgi:hypothetical protein
MPFIESNVKKATQRDAVLLSEPLSSDFCVPAQ